MGADVVQVVAELSLKLVSRTSTMLRLLPEPIASPIFWKTYYSVVVGAGTRWRIPLSRRCRIGGSLLHSFPVGGLAGLPGCGMHAQTENK